MTPRTPLRFDPLILALSIGRAVEEALEKPESGGSVVVVIDLKDPTAFRVLPRAAPDVVIVEHFETATVDLEALLGDAKDFHVPIEALVPRGLKKELPSEPVPPLKKTAPKKIVPTKKPPKRTPSARRQRRP